MVWDISRPTKKVDLKVVLILDQKGRFLMSKMDELKISSTTFDPKKVTPFNSDDKIHAHSTCDMLTNMRALYHFLQVWLKGSKSAEIRLKEWKCFKSM